MLPRSDQVASGSIAFLCFCGESEGDATTTAGGAWRGVQLSCTCREELRRVKLV